MGDAAWWAYPHFLASAGVVRKFARTTRERIRIERASAGGGYRRENLRALARRMEVADGDVRIVGSKGDLRRTLAASGVKPAVTQRA